MAFFITGDCHGNFRRLKIFCNVHPYISREDTMILLGDVGLNYHLNSIDKDNKKLLNEILEKAKEKIIKNYYLSCHLPFCAFMEIMKKDRLI